VRASPEFLSCALAKEKPMPCCPKRFLSIVLVCALISIPTAQAQQTASPAAAPVPPQILSAHTVFVSNGGGSNYFDIFTGGPDRAYNTLYADLRQSNRYQLVDAPGSADLIFEIGAVAPAVGDVNNVAYNPQLILKIIDPKTSAVLWTSSANVRAIGTQKRRDRQFDQAVAILVDKLSQVTGQPLTAEQSKAVRNNSRMPTAEKVIIFSVIAGSAAFAAWGAYRVSHPPAPPQPSLP
jgi:hypothetical protein